MLRPANGWVKGDSQQIPRNLSPQPPCRFDPSDKFFPFNEKFSTINAKSFYFKNAWSYFKAKWSCFKSAWFSKNRGVLAIIDVVLALPFAF